MGTLSEGERRRCERQNRDEFALRLLRSGKAINDCQLRDLTQEGMGVQVADELQPGEALRYELTLPDGVVSGTAVVVWCSAFHMGFRSGLRLQKPGFFARRSLRRALNDAGGGGLSGILDLVLFGTAFGVGLLVLIDLLRSGRWHAVAAKLSSLGR